MPSQNIQEGKIPNFRNSAILHGFFGIIEYTLILISTFIYVLNIALLITCVVIISGLISILGYTLILKNPYYYISCVGLIWITIFPSAISLIIFISFTQWSYEPVKIFIIFALVIEALYIYFLIKEVSYNKYIHYFHKKYGYPFSTAGFTFRGLFYSIREFDKLDKGKHYWQDQNPEEIQKKKEELRVFEKKFKKKFLILTQILAVLSYLIIFGISLIL
jgi:hypothetical protein